MLRIGTIYQGLRKLGSYQFNKKETPPALESPSATRCKTMYWCCSHIAHDCVILYCDSCTSEIDREMFIIP